MDAEMIWLRLVFPVLWLQPLKLALEEAGCTGMTISEARVFDDKPTFYRGARGCSLQPRVRLEIGCSPTDVTFYLAAVRKALGAMVKTETDELEAYVIPLADAIHIRSGLSGRAVL